jgi:lactoylglutathione lyase
MKIDGLSSVLLNVSDLERSRRFYGELLGLAFVDEADEHVLVYEAGATFVVLHVHAELADQGSPPGVEDPGAVLLTFSVDDVDGAVGELRSAGVTVTQEPTDQPWGERSGAILDPDGYTVLLARPLAAGAGD